MNCGIKGHTIAEYCEPQVEKDKRPYFIFGQGGHHSHKCPKKPKPQLSIDEGEPKPAIGRACNQMFADEESGCRSARSAIFHESHSRWLPAACQADWTDVEVVVDSDHVRLV